jgi:eukaryotic-like serine/threonine-protein kinase
MRVVSMPESLGHLSRVRHLGDGSLASVWLYRDERDGSQVAIKSLADEWARRPEVKQRFVDEAQVLRDAAADHVAPVHDIGEAPDGTPYVVMTYGDQGTVADLLGAGPVEATTVDHLLKQACEGVSNLHRVGVVHGDIKPSNLLLCTDEQGGQRVLVSDLGLVKATLYASGLTETAGDPRYLAPEQGVPGGEVDERADVHALGAVAYHLLSGRPLRETPVRDIASATEAQLVSEIAVVPHTLANVVRVATDPDPAERFPDPAAFAETFGLNLVVVDLLREQGIGPEELRTPEQLRHRQERLGVEIAESRAAAKRDRPRLGWMERRLIVGLVSAAVIAVIGFFVQGGDDESEDPPELGINPTSLPPSASYYCRNLPLRWSSAATLTSDELGQVVGIEPAVRDVHLIRRAAPPAIEKTWAEVDDPLRRAAAALDRAGRTWDDLTGPVRRDEPALREARRAFDTAVDRLNGVRTDITRHARSSCEIDLDRFPTLDLR